MRRYGAILVFLAVVAATSHSQVEIRDYVAVVEPVFHERTRRTFSILADHFHDKEDTRWEGFFRWHAGELGTQGHGSGWVYVTEEGTPLMITSRHVVQQAETARVRIEDIEGRIRVFESLPIVYVDDRLDLAVLRLPEGSFSRGFPVSSSRVHDGTRVYAAGYPGFARAPLWQLSNGIVSNAAARIDAHYSYLIQHTAPIDAGNSGGPLLVRTVRTDTGFSVVGVTISKASRRENTSFAIPAGDIAEAITRAEASIRLEREPVGLYRDLQEEAHALALLLASPDPSLEALARFISYASVGERGFQSYMITLSTVTNVPLWVQSFVMKPIETMRASINMQVWNALHSLGDPGATRFVGVVDSLPSLATNRTNVRTHFVVDGSTVEIIWTREYGHWRVKNAVVPSSRRNNPTN